MKNNDVISKEAQNVLKKLEAAGFEAWCVGGCVRDLLLGQPPHDWDVTTSALPEQVMELFQRRAIPTGLKHGTVSVRSGPAMVEVTTYRLEGAYEDRRRPSSVSFTDDLEEDLRRRDFTINAMAFSLEGELRDPLGGRADLRAGILRCVGDPRERFNEDALRIMRAIRFASVLGFTIEPEAAEAVHECRELLRDIAIERIQREVLRLLTGKRAAAVLREYADVFGVFWPELLEMRGFEQHNVHHCYDVWEHTLHALEAVPRLEAPAGVRTEDEKAVLRCAVLLHDIGKVKTFTTDDQGTGHFPGHAAASRDMADEMLRRLRVANVYRTRVVRLVELHDREIVPEERPVRRVLAKLGENDMRLLLVLKRADNLAQAPAYRYRQEELDRLDALFRTELRKAITARELKIKGTEIKALGLSGPAIGQVLEDLLDRVLDEELPNEHEPLQKAAREMAARLRPPKRRRKRWRRRRKPKGPASAAPYTPEVPETAETVDSPDSGAAADRADHAESADNTVNA